MKPYKKPRAQLCVEPRSILSNAQPASFPRPGHWACRAHTHREDHLQVIEHLNLLWESLAAPSHQIVLTVGRRVTGCYRWGIHSKTGRSIIYIVSTVVATGDKEMFEKEPSLWRISCVGRQTLSGGRIMNICVSMHTFPPQLLRTSWRSCLVFLLSSCILSVEVIGKVRDERGEDFSRLCRTPRVYLPFQPTLLLRLSQDLDFFEVVLWRYNCFY